VEILGRFIEQGIPLLITLIFTIYMIIKVDLIYSFAFLFLLILFFITSVYFNYKLRPFRKKRYEFRNIRLKSVVKILMNKQEIMQSDKINKETDKIYDVCVGLSELNKDM
jgi:ABC-type multidrug transport system fused ATPase/permease subunit